MAASTAGGGGTSGGMSSLYSKHNIFNIKCVSSKKKEDHFRWNLNFTNYICRNHSMIAYVIAIQKSKFANI